MIPVSPPQFSPDLDTNWVPSFAELEGVSLCVGKKNLIRNLTLCVQPGNFLVVLGPNGAGKSTLLALLDATLKPSTGRVELFGRNPWEGSERDRAALRVRIGVVPQRTDFNPLIPLTVREVVAIGAFRGNAFSSRLSREDENRIDEAMERMGITGFAHRTYRSLSGGEQQKVQLARAIAQKPSLLLLDEPASGLDLRWQEYLTEIIAQLSRTQSLSIVMTTHILSHVPTGCKRVVLMRDGCILFDGAAELALTSERLGELYDCPVEIIRREGRWHCLGRGIGS